MINLNEILILTSGPVVKLEEFKNRGVVTASFSEVNYSSNKSGLFVGDRDIAEFKVIYFRLVGKSLELATLVANYAKEKGVRIVDRMYETSQLLPVSLGKYIELKKLIDEGVSVPETAFIDYGKMDFPFVVKSTTGQKGREVWLVNNEEELEALKKNKFEEGKFYFAQKLIANAHRVRVLVIGGQALGAIVRQTKWNKDEVKETLNPIPQDLSELAVKAAKTVGLDVCGVDILIDTKTNEKFVIEANGGPSWKLINKYCGVIVEDEIIKFIQREF